MRFLLIAAGIACFVIAGCSEDVSGSARKDDAQPEALCGDKSPLRGFMADWTCGTLAVAGEPELPMRHDEEIEAYRVTWMPSFSPSVIVRLERTVDGKSTMFVKVVYAQAVGKEKTVLADKAFDLEESVFSTYRTELESFGFWQLPVFADELEVARREKGSLVGCMDGTVIYLEGQRNGIYQLASAHCAPFAGVKKVADVTYRLAASHADELNQYR